MIIPPCRWRAAERQTEMEAEEPRPAPMGMVERRVKVEEGECLLPRQR